MAARVLVVDDDPNIQCLLSYALKQEGYEVLAAVDGAAGLKKWSSVRPDWVLVDALLTKLDGYDLTARIRGPGGRCRAEVTARDLIRLGPSP